MCEELKRLLNLAGQHKCKLITSCILSVIGTALGLVPFVIIYLMVLEMFKPAINTAYVWQLVIWSIVAVVLRFAFMGLSYYLSHMAAYSILYHLRIKLAKKLGTLPLGYFNEKNTGNIKTAMMEHVERIELFIAHHLPDMTAAMAVPIFTAILLFIIDWRMTLAMLAVIPFAMAAISMGYRGFQPKMKGYYDAVEKVNSGIIEYTQGMPVIKAFNQTAGSFRKYKDSIEEYGNYLEKWAKMWAPWDSIFTVLVGANLIVLLPVGAWLYISGSLSMPTLILFLILGIGFSAPLRKIMMFSHNFIQVAEGERRINEILMETPLPDPERAKAPSGFDTELLNVHFAYNETEVLHNITFSIPQNTVTALVGPSGAGKSTVARLIPRFWDVNKGEIIIGRTNIKNIPTADLYSLVTFVFQDVFLFNDTVYENIRMGREDVSKAEVIAAAKAARCHEFIELLPDGYQMVIGEHGVRLSAGERQRISIARAILKDAPIIILDEATAFVDPENEDLIQEAIGRLAHGKTLIVVAHRIGTVSEADQIVVLDKGKIVDKGTHSDLVRAGGLYSRMWEAYLSAQDWRIGTKEKR